MRITILWLSGILLLACSTPPSSESANSDSVATEMSNAAPHEYTFTEDSFLRKPLDLDLADTASVKKIATSYSGFAADLEDGSPWYSFHAFDGSLAISYYDFYSNEPQRFYLDEVTTMDPAVKFSKGIQVGMSKADFRKGFNLTDEKSSDAEAIIIHSGDHTARFEFADDLLKSIHLWYDYSAEFPHIITDLGEHWMSIIANEAEGVEERFLECQPYTYNLNHTFSETPDGRPITTLDVGGVMDSRTDTVAWIRRTKDGLLIQALNSQNGMKPYAIKVVFKDEDWGEAEWNGKLFMISEVASTLTKNGCDDEAGSGQ